MARICLLLSRQHPTQTVEVLVQCVVTDQASSSAHSNNPSNPGGSRQRKSSLADLQQRVIEPSKHSKQDEMRQVPAQAAMALLAEIAHTLDLSSFLQGDEKKGSNGGAVVDEKARDVLNLSGLALLLHSACLGIGQYQKNNNLSLTKPSRKLLLHLLHALTRHIPHVFSLCRQTINQNHNHNHSNHGHHGQVWDRNLSGRESLSLLPSSFLRDTHHNTQYSNTHHYAPYAPAAQNHFAPEIDFSNNYFEDEKHHKKSKKKKKQRERERKEKLEKQKQAAGIGSAENIPNQEIGEMVRSVLRLGDNLAQGGIGEVNNGGRGNVSGSGVEKTRLRALVLALHQLLTRLLGGFLNMQVSSYSHTYIHYTYKYTP